VWKAAGVRFENVWLRYDRRSPWVLQAVDVALGRGQVAIVLGKKRCRQNHAAGGGRRTAPPGARHDQRTVPPASAGSRAFSRRTSPSPSAPTSSAWPARTDSARRPRWSRSSSGATAVLTAYFDVNLAEVSKGTAQKVGLVQALVPRPDLLVLDEPWEGLTGPPAELIPDIVGELLAVGGSVLVSDHIGEVTTGCRVRCAGTSRGTGSTTTRWPVGPGPLHRRAQRAGDRGAGTVVAELRGLGH
jgi:hypothetical protein